MERKPYQIEIRRYTAHEDNDTHIGCDSVLAAYERLENERSFGPFRAWVNGKPIRNAYHGLTFDEFLDALDGKLAAASKAYGEFVSRMITNPATFAALGVEL